MGGKKEDHELCRARTERPGEVLQKDWADRDRGGEGSTTAFPEAGIGDLEQIDVKLLPSLPLSWRRAFPKKASVIYFAISKANEILYIGRSVDFNNRWKNHHKLKKLEEMECIKIAWLEVNDSLLSEIELMLIGHFNPPLNETRSLTASEYSTKKWAAKRKNINLTEEDLVDLEYLCKATRRTESDVFREALRQYAKRTRTELNS
jgi:hypothetical protein